MACPSTASITLAGLGNRCRTAVAEGLDWRADSLSPTEPTAQQQGSNSGVCSSKQKFNLYERSNLIDTIFVEELRLSGLLAILVMSERDIVHA